jgi:hypothetical protein
VLMHANHQASSGRRSFKPQPVPENRAPHAAGVVGANFLGSPTLLLPSGLVTLSERRFSRAFLRIPQPPLFSKPPAVK